MRNVFIWPISPFEDLLALALISPAETRAPFPSRVFPHFITIFSPSIFIQVYLPQFRFDYIHYNFFRAEIFHITGFENVKLIGY